MFLFFFTRSYIRIKRNKQTFFIPATSRTSFLEIKTEISKALNEIILPDNMKLFRENDEMADAGTCADQEMKCSDLLYVTFNGEALDGVKNSES